MLLAASLRWTIIASSIRLPVSDAKGVYRGKWTVLEVKAFITSCSVPSNAPPLHHAGKDANVSHPVKMHLSELSTRTIQLTSLILAGIENAIGFAQALLLTEDVCQRVMLRALCLQIPLVCCPVVLVNVST